MKNSLTNLFQKNIVFTSHYFKGNDEEEYAQPLIRESIHLFDEDAARMLKERIAEGSF